jgi:5-methyltetrahydrofolate--homocysteine methyltransferase
MKEEIFTLLTKAIERGKVDSRSSYPQDMEGQDGAVELTKAALSRGIDARDILLNALMPGMKKVGDKFECGEAFIPDLMLSAKAMTAATAILRPYFETAETDERGTFIIGTVSGDLHDIGKNIVKMIMEGAGWNVIDLGTNVDAETFLKSLQEYPNASIGLSALLTTTMVNMENIVKKIKEISPATTVVIGGAPVTESFCFKIGADAYFTSPHLLPEFLKERSL